MRQLGVTKCGNTEFRWGEKTYVMGIINVSPDSFSGDGTIGAAAAVAQAQRFVAEGADILDVGGESTRPGASPVSVEEEIRRVVPVIERLTAEVTLPISVDTYKPEVARRALAAGASLINDQWGLKHDRRLAALAAERNVPIVLMSNRRDTAPGEGDVMAGIVASLKLSLETVASLGVPRENLIIDPGIGFGGGWREGLAIIRRLEELKALARPILIGPSRKSFIGMVLDLPSDERVEGTAAAVAIGIARGADMVRVHDVREMVRVCRMSDAIVRGA